MRIEPFAHRRNFGHEDEMQQINVERASAYILQTASDKCLTSEVGSIMTETHHHDEHQGVHGQRMGKIGPFPPKQMPLEEVGATQKGKHRQNGEEPPRLEQPLGALPVAVYKIAQQEELQELECLVEGTVHHPVAFIPIAQLFGQVEGETGQHTHQP